MISFRDENKAVELVQGMDTAPHHLAFSPVHESTFALAFPTGHVRVFDIRMPQQLLQSYRAHDKAAHQVCFHPSGHYILSVHDDGQIKVGAFAAVNVTIFYNLHSHCFRC
jgi:WD40 repeat protein